MTNQHAHTTEQIGAAWDALASGFDQFVTPATTSLAHETLRLIDPRPGTRLLDVAAGTGALSIPAATAGAVVLATDLAPRMVDLLDQHARAEGLSTLQCRVMDGTALDLDGDSFDVSASVNGVSLFPDLARGLAEMARVTRPGGRVVLASFGPPPKVEFIAMVVGALRAAVPGFTGLPTNPPPLPFQVADPEAMRGALTEAGLREITVHTVTCDMTFDSAEHLWSTFRSSNPLGAQLVASVSPEQQDAAKQVLAGMLSERSGGASAVALHTAVNVGIATVPRCITGPSRDAAATAARER